MNIEDPTGALRSGRKAEREGYDEKKRLEKRSGICVCGGSDCRESE